MNIIRQEEISEGLEKNTRVYLCGNLKEKSHIKHIQTESYEIGISDYVNYTVEKPHFHKYNTEYNYVLCGEVKVLLFDSGEVYQLKAGDLFVINKNEKYVSKCKAGSKVIFSKFPGGNDKILIENTEAFSEWGAAWENEYIK